MPDTVVADDGRTFRCENCGEEEHVSLPMELEEWCNKALDFDKRHTRCKQPES